MVEFVSGGILYKQIQQSDSNPQAIKTLHFSHNERREQQPEAFYSHPLVVQDPLSMLSLPICPKFNGPLLTVKGNQ